MEERRKLLLAMLDAVYFDTKESKSVVAIQPKAGFLTVFQVATTRNGHEVQLIKRPQDHGFEVCPCFWWRRGGSGTIPETQDEGCGAAGVGAFESARCCIGTDLRPQM